ncbi:MAG: RusA family crossover junction endodeoxyribonuclease [SAR202 cluster bacterium]|nr:RusA family crossover junction endodeoxyribonuclease [SAR202 cluster bacterium]
MPKRPLKLEIRIPEYSNPRNKLREAIHRAVVEVQNTTSVKYRDDDKLEVTLRLYFTDERSAEIHDVDNRLKDCLDALQGRVGGTKTKAMRVLEPIVPNDSQVWRVVVEKGIMPKQARGRGHLTIRRLRH